MRTLPVAAIPKGARVRITVAGQPEVTITQVHYSTPAPGRITWDVGGGYEVALNAAELVEIVSLP